MNDTLLDIKTLGELKKSGYRVLPVKEEMRRNLLRKLAAGETVFPGIIGYDKTVIPQLYNAILSRHDFILLGLRGQAKSRILRMLPALLDAYIPIIRDSEINDNPFAPISKQGREAVAEKGDETEIEWVSREQRYGEKLATPDVTIADLIGDIDPIKAAAHRLHYAHEGVIHFGIIPRMNRGIFAINELPDLQPRIQVGLFNLMQEKDIQIRGFPVRIPVDVLMVYSANPEDYTNRGSIITPLKDRIGSQILTHYPADIASAVAITAQEAWVNRGDGVTARIVPFMREIVEQTAVEARTSEYVDQKSGVSARMTISFLENIVSNAERRAFATGAKEAVARICDMFAALSAVTGKIELVYEGEQEGVTNVAQGLLGKAIRTVFLSFFPDPFKAAKKEQNPYQQVLAYFKNEKTVEISDDLPDEAYRTRLQAVPGLEKLVDTHMPEAYSTAAEKAVCMELVLEGLHQNSMLSKDELDNSRVYGDIIKRMFDDLDDDDTNRYA